MSYVDDARADADEVLTSAPPIESIPAHADLEETWDGSDDDDRRLRALLDAAARTELIHEPECEHRDCTHERCCMCPRPLVVDLGAAARAAATRAAGLETRLAASEREVRIHREGHHGALAALAEDRARISLLEGMLAKSDAHGLLCENLLDFLAEISCGLGELDQSRFDGVAATARAAGIDTSPFEQRCSSVLDRFRSDSQRIEDAWNEVRAERERAAACIRGGLSHVPTNDLLADVNRRVVAEVEAIAERIEASRPVPASSIVVARDDAGDQPGQDASQGLR